MGYPTLPEDALLSLYQYGNEVREWKYQGALEALRHVVAKTDDDLSEVALQSLRIGAATTVGLEAPQRVIQREGRKKSSKSSKAYTRNAPEDAGIVSRKVGEAGIQKKDAHS